MNEYYFSIGNGVAVPVGPFYNPLALPIADNGDIPIVYRAILRTLEEQGATPTTNSTTYTLLMDDVTRANLYSWASNANQDVFSLNQTNYGYLTGAWFLNAPTPQRPVHQLGGGRKRMNRTRKGGSLPKNSSLRNRTTQKNRFLSDPDFKQNLVKGLNTPSKKNDEDGGHVSDTIVPISEETFKDVNAILHNPKFNPFWRRFFMPDGEVYPMKGGSTRKTNSKTNKKNRNTNGTKA